MKQKSIKYKFKPSKELLEFAHQISNRFKKLKIGDYYSANKNYHIKILPAINADLGLEELKTPSRFGHTSHVIQLNRRHILPYCKNFIFWSILWCALGIEIIKTKGSEYNLKSEDYYLIDKQTFLAYKITNRPLKRVYGDFIKSIAHAPTQMNIERVKKILKTKPYKK